MKFKNVPVIYKDEKKELKIKQWKDNPNQIVIEFGRIVISLNKDYHLRDIAIMTDVINGVIWEDFDKEDDFSEQVTSGIDVKYLKESAEKLRRIFDAYAILKEGET